MRNKSVKIFWIVIACCIVLLSAGCTNQKTQNNTVPGSTDKVIRSADSASNKNVMKKYITDFLTKGYSNHYIINSVNCEFREIKVTDSELVAIIFTTMNYNFLSYKADPDTIPYIKQAKEKAQKETNPKTKEILQKEYETMAKEHANPFDSNYLFKLTGNLVNGKIDVKSISLFLEGDGPNGPIYTPAEKMLPSDAPIDFIYAREIENTKNTLTLLDHTNVDMNKDGQEESIKLYTAAGKDSKGEIAWDDGQRWLLTVIDGNTEYILFDNYVQLGDLNYWVYTSEQNAVHITTVQNCSASFIVTDYIFDSKKKRFERNVLVNPSNVNMLGFSHY